MSDVQPILVSAHRNGAFHLGDAISGEPQLYCGYTPPRSTPRAWFALALLWRGLLAVQRRLRRTAAQSAPDTPAALPIAALQSQRAEAERRAA